MNNSGRVRNIFVSDYYQFEDYLIRLLLKYGISYVKLGNEFHFLDKIYRFYDIKKDKNIIDYEMQLVKNELIVQSINDLIFLKDKESFEEYFINFGKEFILDVNDEDFNFDEVEYKTNKKKIKSDNRIVNQKLKRKVFFNRQVNGRRGK